MKRTDKEYIEAFFYIVDEKRKRVPFFYNTPQQYVEEIIKRSLKKRFLILKGRKQGLSSLILAKFLVACVMKDNARAVVVSHEKEATRRLFARMRYYLDNFEIKVPTSQLSQEQVSFPATGSTYWISTAGAKASLRGDDVTHLHLSEIDWWENTENVTGMLESLTDIKDAYVFIETTVNGWGSKFHQLWRKAKAGESDFVPVFVPWFFSEKYRLPVPQHCELYEHHDLYGNEKELLRKYGPKGMDVGNILWRRAKLRSMDDPGLFPQEYPCDDIEAFISTGNCPFDTGILSEWYNEQPRCDVGILEPNVDGVNQFYSAGNGWLKVYEHPQPNLHYRIGADVAEGIENEGKDPDYCAASVFRADTWKEVATIRGHWEPDIFADYLDLLGNWYNTAWLGVERNSAGIATLTVLNREKRYRRIYYTEVLDESSRKKTKKMGWTTTERTKGEMISALARAIRQGDCQLSDPGTIEECLSFRRKANGKLEAEGNSHDDRVIGAAIGIQMCKLFPDYDPIAEVGKQFPRGKAAQIAEYNQRLERQR